MNGMAELEAKSMALMAMAENFGKEMSETQIKLWLTLLAKYSPDQVQAGVLRVIETYSYKHIPPFAVLRQAIDAAGGRDESGLDMQAKAEWVQLLAAVEMCGRYGVPALHPTTECVMNMMGGWDAVCDWAIASYDFKRRDFIDLWKNAHGKETAFGLGAAAVLGALVDGVVGQRLELAGKHRPVAEDHRSIEQ